MKNTWTCITHCSKIRLAKRIPLPESGRPEDENNDEPGEGDIEPMVINTPAREQEEQGTRREREISGEINTPSPQTAQATRPADNIEESRPLDGSTTIKKTRRKSSSRRSIPTDR